MSGVGQDIDKPSQSTVDAARLCAQGHRGSTWRLPGLEALQERPLRAVAAQWLAARDKTAFGGEHSARFEGDSGLETAVELVFRRRYAPGWKV
jgi:hypothetical protein